MLLLEKNLQSYFEEAISKAIARSQSPVGIETQTYLVHLLSEYSRSDKVYAGVNSGEEPVLVTLLERALESPPTEANRLFKHIGDSTLYLTGFFGERSHTRGLDASYYIAMGESAYAQLAKSTRVAIYSQLSEWFERLVYLLRQVRYYQTKPSSEEIVSWIQLYQRTKCVELQALLASQGVYIGKEDPTC